MKEINPLPLHVSILDMAGKCKLTTSSLVNGEILIVEYSYIKRINTFSDGVLLVTNNVKLVDVCELDKNCVVISDPHHKHIELD